MRGSVWSLAAAIMTQSSGVAVTYLVSRRLGAGDLGEFGIVQSTLATIGILAGVGLATTTTRFVSQLRRIDPARAGRMLGIPLVVGLSVSSVVGLLILGLAEPIARSLLGAPDLAGLLRLAAPLVVLNTVYQIQVAGLSGLEAYLQVAKSSLAYAVSRVLFSAGLALNFGIRGAIVGLVIAELIYIAILTNQLREACRASGISISYRGFRTERHELLRFALPTMLSSLILGPVTWACNAVLYNLPSGRLQMGFVSATSQWQSLVKFVPQRMLDVSLPILSNLHGDGKKQDFARMLRSNHLVVAVLTFSICLPLIIMSDMIMKTYGLGFEGTGPVLSVMVLSAALHMFARAMTQSMIARGLATHEMAFAGLRACLLMSVFWLLRERGAMGLALATASSYVGLIAALCGYRLLGSKSQPVA